MEQPSTRPATTSPSLLLWTKGTVAVVLLGLSLKSLAESVTHVLGKYSQGENVVAWLGHMFEHEPWIRWFLTTYVLLNSLRFFLASFTADVEQRHTQATGRHVVLKNAVDLLSTLGTMLLVALSAQALQLPSLHHAVFVFFCVSALDAILTLASRLAWPLADFLVKVLKMSAVLDDEVKKAQLSSRDKSRSRWLTTWLRIDLCEVLLWLFLYEGLYRDIPILALTAAVALVVSFAGSFAFVPDYWRELGQLTMPEHEREG